MEQAKLKALEDNIQKLEEEIMTNHQNVIQSIEAIKEELKDHIESEDVKYYLYAEGCGDYSGFLNQDKQSGAYMLDDYDETPSFQTRFTLQEIEAMPDWCQALERIECQKLIQ